MDSDAKQFLLDWVTMYGTNWVRQDELSEVMADRGSKLSRFLSDTGWFEVSYDTGWFEITYATASCRVTERGLDLLKQEA